MRSRRTGRMAHVARILQRLEEMSADPDLGMEQLRFCANCRRSSASIRVCVHNMSFGRGCGRVGVVGRKDKRQTMQPTVAYTADVASWSEWPCWRSSLCCPVVRVSKIIWQRTAGLLPGVKVQNKCLQPVCAACCATWVEGTRITYLFCTNVSRVIVSWDLWLHNVHGSLMTVCNVSCIRSLRTYCNRDRDRSP